MADVGKNCGRNVTFFAINIHYWIKSYWISVISLTHSQQMKKLVTMRDCNYKLFSFGFGYPIYHESWVWNHETVRLQSKSSHSKTMRLCRSVNVYMKMKITSQYYSSYNSADIIRRTGYSWEWTNQTEKVILLRILMSSIKFLVDS